MMSMVLQVCYQVTIKQLWDNYDVYGIYNVYSVYRDFQSLLMYINADSKKKKKVSTIT
jgi:hypothetical protein